MPLNVIYKSIILSFSGDPKTMVYFTTPVNAQIR